MSTEAPLKKVTPREELLPPPRTDIVPEWKIEARYILPVEFISEDQAGVKLENRDTYLEAFKHRANDFCTRYCFQGCDPEKEKQDHLYTKLYYLWGAGLGLTASFGDGSKPYDDITKALKAGRNQTRALKRFSPEKREEEFNKICQVIGNSAINLALLVQNRGQAEQQS